MSSKRQQRYISARSVTSTAPIDLTTDEVVDIERVPVAAIKESHVRPQQSISAGPAYVEAAAEGAEWAICIREAWRCNLPVRKVSQQEWDRMVANNIVF